VLEDRLVLNASRQRQVRARCWLEFERFSGLEISHSRKRTLSSNLMLVYAPNKRKKVLTGDKDNDGYTTKCDIPIGVKINSHVHHPDAS
jgi:hypothetical protein